MSLLDDRRSWQRGSRRLASTTSASSGTVTFAPGETSKSVSSHGVRRHADGTSGSLRGVDPGVVLEPDPAPPSNPSSLGSGWGSSSTTTDRTDVGSPAASLVPWQMNGGRSAAKSIPESASPSAEGAPRAHVSGAEGVSAVTRSASSGRSSRPTSQGFDVGDLDPPARCTRTKPSASTFLSTRFAVGRVTPASCARSSWVTGMTVAGARLRAERFRETGELADHPYVRPEVHRVRERRRQPADLERERLLDELVDPREPGAEVVEQHTLDAEGFGGIESGHGHVSAVPAPSTRARRRIPLAARRAASRHRPLGCPP